MAAEWLGSHSSIATPLPHSKGQRLPNDCVISYPKTRQSNFNITGASYLGDSHHMRTRGYSRVSIFSLISETFSCCSTRENRLGLNPSISNITRRTLSPQGALLRVWIGGCSQCSPKFCYGPNSKPAFRHLSGSLAFNMSHSGDAVLSPSQLGLKMAWT